MTERRIPKLKYEGKIFIYGILLGSLFGVLWQDFFFHHHFFKDDKSCVNVQKIEATVNKEFISYVNGKWSSSVGDLVVKIDDAIDKSVIVIEDLDEVKSNAIYKIHKITNVNGIMGVMNMDICPTNRKCTKEDLIPLQINKIFGRDKTIAISYDSRLTYCIDSEDKCTRAFKRIID